MQTENAPSCSSHGKKPILEMFEYSYSPLYWTFAVCICLMKTRTTRGFIASEVTEEWFRSIKLLGNMLIGWLLLYVNLSGQFLLWIRVTGFDESNQGWLNKQSWSIWNLVNPTQLLCICFFSWFYATLKDFLWWRINALPWTVRYCRGVFIKPQNRKRIRITPFKANCFSDCGIIYVKLQD